MSSLRKLIAGLLALCTLALVACGGSGSAGTPVLGGSSGGSTTSVSDLQITFSPATVDNSGTQNVTATITAIDGNGMGLSGVTVTLRVDNNATYTVTSTSGLVTGSDGKIVANVTIGNDYSIRTVTMSASSGSVSRSSTFRVTGSTQVASDLTVSINPANIPNSIANTATVTVTAVDANRNALANIPVTLAVDNGAVITPSATATSSAGTVTGALRIGQDQTVRVIRVTATSGTVVRTLDVPVTGATLTASGYSSIVNTSSTGNRVVFLLSDNTGTKMVGYPITVATSGLAPVSGTTSSSGEFTYTYDAPSTAQDLTISATAGGVTSQTTVRVAGTAVVPVATVTASSLSASVAAAPNVVAVNNGSSTTINKTEIRALFLGPNNAPVKNVRVWFDLNGDPQSIGGTLDSTATGVLQYSDANGVARTTYAPGARFSPKDGVTVRVCYSHVDFAIADCGNAAVTQTRTSTLTVVSDSLSVSIGTNGTIGIGDSGLTYTKRFAVQVVDSAGQAKTGVQVSPSLDLIDYRKGQWEVLTGATRWSQGGHGNAYPTTYPGNNGSTGGTVPTAARSAIADTFTVAWTLGNVSICGNEDLNRNGVFESFPDAYELVSIPEDQNGSGDITPVRPRLDPRKADVTVSIEGSSTTDSNGIVVVKIEYPQNLASWVRFNLLVAASGVAGTEGRANFDSVLPVLASAVTNIQADPPFRFSPYGTEGTNTFLRQNAEGQSAWLCTNPY